MHYKNGREAHEGQPVICKGYAGQITVGKIHTLIPDVTTCNCSVAETFMGGVNQLTCRTINEMYHAEDAFAAIEATMAAAPAAPVTTGGWPVPEPPHA